MISSDMEKMLNSQLNYELFSAYQYAAVSAYFETQNLNGFTHWVEQQVKEEMDHAARFYRYINDIGGRVSLEAIGKPRAEFDSPLQAFEAAYEHEVAVTQRIYELADLAHKENDHATSTFLQWFINEQVEEEKNADEVVQKLKLIGSDPNGLFMLDLEMAKRTAEKQASTT